MVIQQEKAHKQIYTPFKRWSFQFYSLLVVLVPIVCIELLKYLYAPNSAVKMLFDLANIIVILFLLFWGLTALPFLCARRMRPQLLAKVQAVYGENPVDAPMVGFSPGSGMKLYSGDTCSDFGFLVMKPGKMSYLGDTLTFELSPWQIENVTHTEQSCWGSKIPRLLIGWREKPESPCQGFMLEVWDSSSLWDARAKIQSLLECIENWRQA